MVEVIFQPTGYSGRRPNAVINPFYQIGNKISTCFASQRMGQPEGVIEICKYEVIRKSPYGLNNRKGILVPYRLRKNRHLYKQRVELKKRQNKKRQTGLWLYQTLETEWALERSL
jgi:hypothetical protein